MQTLKDIVLSSGKAVNSDVMKVDSFITHQVDPSLMEQIGKDFAEHFKTSNITKIATIESSGIAPALMTAKAMNVPLIIFKKEPSRITNGSLLQTEVTSFTTAKTYELTASPKFIKSDDNVLIIDDFLANGEAITGAVRILRMAHATVGGVGILIEKTFQPGRRKLENAGFEVYSLVKVKSLKPGKIELED